MISLLRIPFQVRRASSRTVIPPRLQADFNRIGGNMGTLLSRGATLPARPGSPIFVARRDCIRRAGTTGFECRMGAGKCGDPRVAGTSAAGEAGGMVGGSFEVLPRPRDPPEPGALGDAPPDPSRATRRSRAIGSVLLRGLRGGAHGDHPIESLLECV